MLVSERGAGNAKFLFIRTANRATEVSESSDSFYIEYWNHADEESDVDSVKKEIVKLESEVLAKIKIWLGDKQTSLGISSSK